VAQNGNITKALAAGTADRSGRLIHNRDFRGAHFIVTGTSKAGATVTNVYTIEGLVPGTTGTFYTILQSAALGVATTRLRVYPGLSTAANLVANDVLPEYFRVRSTSGTTGTLNSYVDVNLVI
jgi:hypothetical protein